MRSSPAYICPLLTAALIWLFTSIWIGQIGNLTKRREASHGQTVAIMVVEVLLTAALIWLFTSIWISQIGNLTSGERPAMAKPLQLWWLRC